MDYRLKTMTLGEMLDASINVFKDNFWLLCAITAVVVFVPQLVANVFPSFVQLMGPRGIGEGGAAEEQALVMFFIMFGAIAFSVLIMLLLAPFANAAVVKVVADRYLGNPTSFRAAYGYVFGRFWKLVTAVLLRGLIIFAAGVVSICLLGALGYYMTLYYFVVSPVVVVEDIGGWPALQRSGQLMSGNKLTAFVLWILVGAIGLLLGLGSGFVPQIWVRGLLQAGFNVLTTAFYQVMVTIMYLHARCEKEALDLEHLAASLGSGPEAVAASEAGGPGAPSP